MTRQRIITFLKFAIGIALIILLFARLPDPTGLWRQMAQANKLLLLLGALCYTAAVAVSGLKWGVLLAAVQIHVPASRLLSYQWQAEFFNSFLPAQVGGDVARGYALAVDTHRSADAAASVVIDRFIGLFVFMACATLFSAAMLLWGRPNGEPFTSDQLLYMRLVCLGSALVTTALVCAMVGLLSRRLKLLFERILGVLPIASKSVPIWQSAAQAFNRYRYEYKALALVALGSLLITFLTSINIWLIAAAIQPGAITLMQVLAINPIIVFIALILPLSPGGLGVRQGAFFATFLLVGASGALGLAVGLTQQFIGYIVSIPGGILWMRGGKSGGADPSQTPAQTPISSPS
jgi:uncharacterized protein (TIRG00374 family)